MTEAFLERRRAAAAAAWNLDGGVVLVAAGDEIPCRGAATALPVPRALRVPLPRRPRTPRRRAGLRAGDGWVEFVAPVTAEELLWTGLEGDREGVPEGTRPLGELKAWVAAGRCAGSARTPMPTSSCATRSSTSAAPRTTSSSSACTRPRRRRAPASRSSCRRSPPGRSERELQVALEAAFLRNGGDFLAFESIVAAGDHAAVLHFSPTARELRDGDLLLVDAGAEHRGYASDVTRTYAAGGAFTAEQALVHDTVRRAGETAIAACRPGVEWHDVHRAAALVVAEGLLELGVLRGSPEMLVESGAATIFFPHGVGHMVGLGVRDTGAASDEASEPVPGLPPCASTSRSNRATRGRSSRASTSCLRCSPGGAAVRAWTGSASKSCRASAACASSRTC